MLCGKLPTAFAKRMCLTSLFEETIFVSRASQQRMQEISGRILINPEAGKVILSGMTFVFLKPSVFTAGTRGVESQKAGAITGRQHVCFNTQEDPLGHSGNRRCRISGLERIKAQSWRAV
jgi:hypothetical protein